MHEFSKRFRFSDWPNPQIPQVAAGVYVIWDENTLLYCGMSGRGIEKAVRKKRYGLITRLEAHSRGRLSGDQFCVYVANRLVIPSLTPCELLSFASGELTLDDLTRAFIRGRLEYQYVIVATSQEGFNLEARARSGDLFGMKPYLNPA